MLLLLGTLLGLLAPINLSVYKENLKPFATIDIFKIWNVSMIIYWKNLHRRRYLNALFLIYVFTGTRNCSFVLETVGICVPTRNTRQFTIFSSSFVGKLHNFFRWCKQCLCAQEKHFQHLRYVNCKYFSPNVIGLQAYWFTGKIRMRFTAGGAPVNIYEAFPAYLYTFILTASVLVCLHWLNCYCLNGICCLILYFVYAYVVVLFALAYFIFGLWAVK
jgi:hypothetical protein